VLCSSVSWRVCNLLSQRSSLTATSMPFQRASHICPKLVPSQLMHSQLLPYQKLVSLLAQLLNGALHNLTARQPRRNSCTCMHVQSKAALEICCMVDKG